MKNLFYIPFLAVVAISYTRFLQNPSSLSSLYENKTNRAPASVVEVIEEPKSCETPHQKFNPHYQSENCL